jgi:hypothetical protein
MKVLALYSIIFSLGVTAFVIMISAAPSPESLIIGEWSELAWEYEKVNSGGDDSFQVKEKLSDELKKKIGKDLLIHEAETWTFLPNNRLKLSDGWSEKIVHWNIKGRGHILQLKYEGDIVENYNLTKLSDHVLVLNFESDVQARGIAKLTFEKLR